MPIVDVDYVRKELGGRGRHIMQHPDSPMVPAVPLIVPPAPSKVLDKPAVVPPALCAHLARTTSEARVITSEALKARCERDMERGREVRCSELGCAGVISSEGVLREYTPTANMMVAMHPRPVTDVSAKDYRSLPKGTDITVREVRRRPRHRESAADDGDDDTANEGSPHEGDIIASAMESLGDMDFALPVGMFVGLVVLALWAMGVKRKRASRHMVAIGSIIVIFGVATMLSRKNNSQS